jgi:hypothetical protein
MPLVFYVAMAQVIGLQFLDAFYRRLDNFLVSMGDDQVWDMVVEVAKLITLLWGVFLWVAIADLIT